MKILIFTETIAGKGHEKAAFSIKKAFKQLDQENEIKIISTLSIINKHLEKLIASTYMLLITKYPSIWKWMYKRESGFSLLFKKVIANFVWFHLNKLMEREKPDLVIATHATGLGALSKLKPKKKFKLAAILTDYNVNSFWIHEYIDYYFVGHEKLKNRLINLYKIPENRVFITGIPIDPSFANITFSKTNQPNKENRYKILIMGGGLGLGGIKELIFSLQKIDDFPILITVVTGTNKNLYNELVQVNKAGVLLEVLPYVDNIADLMNRSNILITKPGGLTVSEALTIPIPILIFKPIPGQEEKNADFLIKMKAAIRVNSIEQMLYWIKYLYYHPKLSEKLKYNERRISMPKSSISISKILTDEQVEKKYNCFTIHSKTVLFVILH